MLWRIYAAQKDRYTVETSVRDVAAYVIEKLGPTPLMKLHKLVYYCQAWSLVWHNHQLFSEVIDARNSGPVIMGLATACFGQYPVATVNGGDALKLSEAERNCVSDVIRSYGKMTPNEISHMVKNETPWLIAKSRGSFPGHMITLLEMQNYYASL